MASIIAVYDEVRLQAKSLVIYGLHHLMINKIDVLGKVDQITRLEGEVQQLRKLVVDLQKHIEFQDNHINDSCRKN
jgi:hypothetical protein